MSNIDMKEVQELHDDLVNEATSLIKNFATAKTSLSSVKDMDSFEGKGAQAVKNYIGSAHNTLNDQYSNALEALKSSFKSSISDFSGSVDSDGSCIIKSAYVSTLNTELESACQMRYNQLMESLVVYQGFVQ